jgi:hypothetical protein
MKKRYLAGLAALMLVALPGIAQAEPLEFTLDNTSSHNILYIYVSTPDSEEWGDDILGENYLFPAGTSGKVTIGDAAGKCEFDLQFILDSKQTIVQSGVSLCGGVTDTISDK